MKSALHDLAQSYSGLATVVLLVVLIAFLGWSCDEYERRKNRK